MAWSVLPLRLKPYLSGHFRTVLFGFQGRDMQRMEVECS